MQKRNIQIYKKRNYCNTYRPHQIRCTVDRPTFPFQATAGSPKGKGRGDNISRLRERTKGNASCSIAITSRIEFISESLLAIMSICKLVFEVSMFSNGQETTDFLNQPKSCNDGARKLYVK